MQESEFTGCVNKVQEHIGVGGGLFHRISPLPIKCDSLLPIRRVDGFRCFLYDKLVGRLAQRLEHSVYTRKVVRSNRTVPTIRE